MSTRDREHWGQGYSRLKALINRYAHIFVYRLRQIFWLMDTDPLEVGIAFLMLGFSLQLLNPLYDTFNTGRTYEAMRGIASDTTWGLIGLFLSLCNIVTVVLNLHKLKVLTNFGLMVHIMFIAALIGLSNPYGTGVSTYAGLTFLMMIVTLRSAKDAV